MDMNQIVAAELGRMHFQLLQTQVQAQALATENAELRSKLEKMSEPKAGPRLVDAEKVSAAE